MSAEDTVQPKFYSVWPNLGKKFAKQLGEIRTDTSSLQPVVRGIGLDAAGDFSSLSGIAENAVQSREIGKQDFHNRFRTHYNKTTDVFEIAYNTGTTLVPNWYTTWWIDNDGHVTQQNTPTTASNVGGGSEVFKQKVGVDLEFRTLTATSPITLTENASTIDVDGSALVSTYSSDRPAAPSGDANAGVEIILSDTGKVANDLPFKAIKAGPNIVVRNLLGTAIEIESTAQVVEFYGIGVGHDDLSKHYPEVHNFLVNRAQFYVTQQTTDPSNKTIILNSIGEPFTSTDYVAVVGDDMTGPLAQADGSAALPSFTFTDDTTMGLTRLAADDLGVAIAGAAHTRFLSDRLLTKQVQITNVGNASAPDLYFFPDSDTGVYQDNVNELAFATKGKHAGHFDSDQNLVVENFLKASQVEAGKGEFYTSLKSDLIQIRTGSLNPGFAQFSWEDDPDTGLIDVGVNSFGLMTGGTTRLTLSTTQVVSTLPIEAPAGTAVNPGFDFALGGGAGLGLYESAANTLSFATSGAWAASLYSGGTFRTAGAIQSGHSSSVGSPAYSFFNGAGDSNTGIYQIVTNDGGVAFTCDGVRAGYFEVAGVRRNFRVDNTIVAELGHIWAFAGDLRASVGNIFADAGDLYATAGNIYTTAGNITAAGDVFTTDDPYGVGWDGSSAVPTKNAVYDKIESLDLDNEFENLTVFDTLSAGRVEAGPSTFYGQVKFEGGNISNIVIGTDDDDNHNNTPQITFGGSEDSGFGFDNNNNRPIITQDGAIKMYFHPSFIGMNEEIRLIQGTTSDPSMNFINSSNTGLYQITNADNTIAFTSGGSYVGHWAGDGLHVLNDVNAGRVEAGIGTFYTNTYIGDGTVGLPALAFNSDKTTGIYGLAGGTVMNFAVAGTQAMRFAAGAVALPSATLYLRTGGGSEGVPALSFWGDTNTGLWGDDDDTIHFSTGGSEAGHFDSGQNLHVTNDLFVDDLIIEDTLSAGRVHAGPSVFYIQDEGTSAITVSPGSAGAPAIISTIDDNTGIYWNAANSMIVSANGSASFQVTNSKVRAYRRFEIDTGGTAAVPMLTFAADINTGLYQLTDGDDGTIAFSTGGVHTMTLSSDGLTMPLYNTDGRDHQILAATGHTSIPGYAFNGDPNVGFSQGSSEPGTVRVVSGLTTQLWTADYTELQEPIHLDKHNTNAGDPTEPDLLWRSASPGDPHVTGLYLSIGQGADTNGMNVSIVGERGALFSNNKNLSIFGGTIGDAIGGGSINVVDDLTAGRVEAGYGNFYVGIILPQNKGGDGTPALSFEDAPDTGFEMYGSASTDQIRLIAQGNVIQTWNKNGITWGKTANIRAAGTAAVPFLAFSGDSNTGIYQVNSGGDDLAITTAGKYAAHFDSDQSLHVENDVNASRVEAGIGNFYTAVTSYQFLGKTGSDRSKVVTYSFEEDPNHDSGLGWNQGGGGYPVFMNDGVLNMFFAGYIGCVKPLRIYSSSAAVPGLASQNDGGTGLWMTTSDPDKVNFATDSINRATIGNTGMNIEGNLWVDNEASAQTGFFYTALHIGGHTPGGDADNAEMWKFSSIQDENLEIRPTRLIRTVSGQSHGRLQIEGGVDFCERQAEYLDNDGSPSTSFDTHLLLSYAPDDVIKFGNFPRSWGFLRCAPTVEYAGTLAFGQVLNFSGTHTSTGEIADLSGSYIAVFVASPTFSSTIVGGKIPTAGLYQALPFFKNATGETQTTTNLASLESIMYNSDVTVQGIGDGGSITMPFSAGYASRLQLTTNHAGATATVADYVDFWVRGTTTSGGGSEVLTLRDVMRVEDDTLATEFNVIKSAVTAGATKRFINHTGGASSKHVGNFDLDGALDAEVVVSGIGAFYTSLEAPRGWHTDTWTVHSDETAIAWTNKPAALTEFRFDRYRTMRDLRSYREWRIVIHVWSTNALTDDSVIGVQFSDDGGTTWYGLDNGTEATMSDANIIDNLESAAPSKLTTTSWTDINASAQVEDAILRAVGEDGDGVIDPAYGMFEVQFRG